MPVDPLGAELKSLRDRIYALERRGMYPPAVADSAWQVVSSFSNSWVNYPGGSWPSAAYRIDSEGWVTMRGLLTGGANGTIAFTLPTGYRPQIPSSTKANGGDSAAHITVGTSGAVTVISSSVSHMSLGQVTFPVWGLDNLVSQRLAIPPYTSDSSPYRFPRLLLRRSGMYELTGVANPWAGIGVGDMPWASAASLFGVGPDDGDIFGVQGPSNSSTRLDVGSDQIGLATSTTGYGILGGIRWPGRTVEPLYASMTLLNGWANYGYGTKQSWGPAKYVKDSNGYVHLRGLIKHAAGTSTTQIATLPAGFRPGGRTMFITQGNSAAVGVDVFANGDVYPRNATDRTFLSLAGISFLAEN
jgi:hypothetical protein